MRLLTALSGPRCNMPEIPEWIGRLLSLSSEVIIVVLFLYYLRSRDKVVEGIAERCHVVQEAGHEAMRELTAAVMRCNGNRSTAADIARMEEKLKATRSKR